MRRESPHILPRSAGPHLRGTFCPTRHLLRPSLRRALLTTGLRPASWRRPSPLMSTPQMMCVLHAARATPAWRHAVTLLRPRALTRAARSAAALAASGRAGCAARDGAGLGDAGGEPRAGRGCRSDTARHSRPQRAARAAPPFPHSTLPQKGASKRHSLARSSSAAPGGQHGRGAAESTCLCPLAARFAPSAPRVQRYSSLGGRAQRWLTSAHLLRALRPARCEFTGCSAEASACFTSLRMSSWCSSCWLAACRS